ncbi:MULTISPECIES: pyridoxamine 5'-phosphate oxidase family protein [Gordonibacter]|uniref:Pyridoxamine 5'-phosphate oxidase family protein n=1 Tax=Gordonibacter faecis TaxID=3047475 RepID=A0ABT7DJA0_9ACTN|nr:MULTISPECIES: pyridoxamine 5'-phosphate oxidase family protein [unclassified Gordonibacter]MDJ1649462.1 pyridoxamine 5'-phosphate oxidase family protein [Gordonibacter sp. KGMB12511]HIW75083.1 pyridoxamine 5'-phosphate oxidase family protein [Candidatus Gordonibacter avicola]
MAHMSQECQDMINNAYAAAFSTCADGVPNVVPVSMKQAMDAETVMVSDQYLNKSLANLQANPYVALSVWDDEGGFQVKGTVTYENEGPRYEQVAAQVQAILSSMGYDYTSKGVCFIHVEEVYSVTPGAHAGERLA